MSKPLFALILAAILPHGRAAASDLWEKLEAEAARLRPTADDVRWESLPWMTDPDSAFSAARTENRPVFLWVAGGRGRDGSPLERC